MNRAQRRSSGLRCHDCNGRNVIVQADYGWLCDPCWVKREERIKAAVLAGATSVRPIDQDRPAPMCSSQSHGLAAPCSRDAVAVVQFARNGRVIDYATCEQHMAHTMETVLVSRERGK